MRQLGELTEETDYGKLQKTYSIWVCYDLQIPKKLKNTLSRYKITRDENPCGHYSLCDNKVVLVALKHDYAICHKIDCLGG